MSIEKTLAMTGGFLKIELVLPLGGDSGQMKADREPPPEFVAPLAPAAPRDMVPHDGSQLEKGTFNIYDENSSRVGVVVVTYGPGDMTGVTRRTERWAFNAQYREPGSPRDTTNNVQLTFAKTTSVDFDDAVAFKRHYQAAANGGFIKFWEAICSLIV